MNDILRKIDTGLNIYKSLYGFGKKTFTLAKSRLVEPLRVEKLSDDFFSSSINAGTVVTVQGFLSKYGYCYKPTTYSATLLGPGEEKQIGLARDQKTGRFLKRMQAKASVKLFQFPVQILPECLSEKGPYSIAFLYPEDIQSFILNADNTKKDKSENNLDITSIHRAIPVLLNREDIHNSCESYVKLTGIVSLLPESLTEGALNSSETLNDFSYHYCRPFSPNLGFCLDCRDKYNCDFNIIEKPNSFYGALFVEAHLEGINPLSFENEIRNSIPNVLPISFRWGDEKRTFYNIEDKISVVGSDDNFFGFYVETDLLSQNVFDKDLKYLVDFYQSFRKKVMNNIREKSGKEAKLKPDFVYDYRRQKLFHPEGVLQSQEAEQVISTDPKLGPVSEWVKTVQ